ncbi:MAG: hypothetical protein ACK5LM_06980 [Lactovum sp.]
MKLKGKEIGGIFRRLRLERGYKIANFKEVGISASSICRFEIGKSVLSTNKFFLALEFMEISLSEFDYFYYNDHKRVEIIDQIKKDYFHLNYSQLNNYLKTTQDPILKLSIKSLISSLSSKKKAIKSNDKDILLSYLSKVSLWGTYELSILSFITSELSKSQILYFLKEILNDNPNFFENHYYEQLILFLYLQVSFHFLKLKEEIESQKALDFIFKFSGEEHMFYQNIAFFFSGYHELIFNDCKVGRKKMQNAINIFKLLKKPGQAQFLEKIIEEHIRNDEE